MTKAKIAPTSLLGTKSPTPFGPVKDNLGPDRRQMPTLVPKVSNYGDMELTVVVGIDAEWVNLGDWNRVVSYQYFCSSVPGGEWQGLLHPNAGSRFRLDKFLACIIADGIAQGHLASWPVSLYLVTHFAVADLIVFADFPNLKKHVDSVRKTFVTLGRPLRLNLWDKHRHKHLVEVVIRDTMLLAPAKKQSLDDLGELIQLEKLPLTHDEKRHMDALLQNDPVRFSEYALRDPEICVRYARRIMKLNRELLGKLALPSTLSSIGVSCLLQNWVQAGIDKHAVMGMEIVPDISWSKKTQRKITRNKAVATADRHAYESLATECYHGGRNEQFFFGAGAPGSWTDWDLVGAYPTAMAEIGMPQWAAIRQTRDLDEFQPLALGYARVRFEFPPNTRFPCLPVRTVHGLIFPLRGDTYCCAPEISLAKRLGARLEVVNGIILPTVFEVRPFESFIIDCTKRRNAFPKGSLEELFWKEVGNGTYGKSAQGLRDKRAFNSRTDTHINLPPSRITNPFFAAHTTSLVRAVLGEILAALPLHRTVCNATTDGLLTNSTDAEVEAAARGPLSSLFAQARLRISGDPKFLEVKHRIAQPLGWRTRGQATLETLPGHALVLAKAGIKLRDEVRNAGECAQNEFIFQLFVSRDRESREHSHELRGLLDIYRNGGDLVAVPVSRSVSMEYDWKRRPVDASTRPIRGHAHLYFDTFPWADKSEFDECREDFEAFRGRRAGILKTEADLRNFLEFCAARRTSSPIVRIPRRAPAMTLAKRYFLRALVRSKWGLDRSAMSYSEVAAWLSRAGMPTTKSDLENANRPRALLQQNLVPQTPEVLKFVAMILEAFPAFDATKLLARPAEPLVPLSAASPSDQPPESGSDQLDFGAESSVPENAERNKTAAKAAQHTTMKKMKTNKIASSETTTQIDETILSRFRNSKIQGLKDLEKAGSEAGVCFVNRHAEFVELRRLERWCNETRGNQRVYLEGLGLTGLADVLAGGEGQGQDVVNVLEELGGEDANEGEWLEAFVEAALKQFGQIEAQL